MRFIFVPFFFLIWAQFLPLNDGAPFNDEDKKKLQFSNDIVEMFNYCARVDPKTGLTPMRLNVEKPELMSIYRHYCLRLNNKISGTDYIFEVHRYDWSLDLLEKKMEHGISKEKRDTITKLKKLQQALDIRLYSLLYNGQEAIWDDLK